MVYGLVSIKDMRYMFDCPFPSLMGQNELREKFPLLDSKYKWGVIYYDGEMDDSRINLESILTSTIDNYVEGWKGSNCLNYCRFDKFIKNEEGRITGAVIIDKVSGEEIQVNCKAIINATGSGADHLRLLDDPLLQPRMVHSRGTHMVLGSAFCHRDFGLLIPKTSDGRLLFILPWQDGTIIGTTDDMIPRSVIHPTPTSKGKTRLIKDIDWISGELCEYYPTLNQKGGAKEHIQSHWSGVRPLVLDDAAMKNPRIVGPNGPIAANIKSADICRKHLIETSDSGLISVMGGKWTIYRSMGEEAVHKSLDYFVKSGQMSQDEAAQKKRPSNKYLRLLGDYRTRIAGSYETKQKLEAYHRVLALKLRDLGGTADINHVNYLSRTYGARAKQILEVMKENEELARRIHPQSYITRAEIRQILTQELVVDPLDLLLRRCRTAFTNASLAEELLVVIVDEMGNLASWPASQRKKIYNEALEQFRILRFTPDIHESPETSQDEV